MPENFSIVPANLAVRALRDSGYKDTAHAIAELVDNAVQAKGKTIEILCVEEEVFINTRTRSRVKAVATEYLHTRATNKIYYWCSRSKMIHFGPGKAPVLAPSWDVGADKQAQGCAGEGLKPKGLSLRMRARVLLASGNVRNVPFAGTN